MSSPLTPTKLPSLPSHPSLRSLLLTLPPWFLLLSLIFGGCCSNAYFLERTTSIQPSCGTLLTFLHFLVTALVALPGQLDLASSRVPSIKKPKVPLSRWAVQVALYYATSLLNNTAFAYDVPMPVHIIFRSGGLVVNMLVGWAVKRRRYSPLQIASVLLVTGGVILSTFATSPGSSSGDSSGSKSSSASSSDYFLGIALLTLALLLSSFMGLYQETTFAAYGSEHWREALFYSHALSLPLFLASLPQLRAETQAALQTPPLWLGWGAPAAHIAAPGGRIDLRAVAVGTSSGSSGSSGEGVGLLLPSLLPPLALNVATQLLCINGVNRLTARVSSLTVTLVLVVRKAASLAISLLLVGGARGANTAQLAAGATAVLVGTVGYTLGAGGGGATSKEKEKKKQ